MTQFVFPYVEQEHPIFGKVKRPLVEIALYSERFAKWLLVDKVLADTGADISVTPLPFGQILFFDVESGQPIQLGGAFASNLISNAFVHQVKAKMGSHEFEMPIAVSTSSKIPLILGRQGALDQFKVSFVHDIELILEI